MAKILLDTDIGTDVDDAVCLVNLLAQPNCELLGITTVTGEAERRASLASILCLAAGKQIPSHHLSRPAGSRGHLRRTHLRLRTWGRHD
jgi:inosine-uridine nucleoside N-ribohydrolase